MIRLQEILPIGEPNAFKLHFGRYNGQHEPLDEWVRDHEKWVGWQEYRPSRDDFNRPHIFSVMNFHPEPGVWLFGGVFDVVERLPDRYIVSLSPLGQNMIGRLKIHHPYYDRATRVRFENHYGEMQVSEILREPYGGRSFPGFDAIDLSFDELETLVLKNRLDWRQALISAKGVYLITDTLTHKRYVGSAYGEQGIWSRWMGYVQSGHGGNAELRLLVPEANLDYCRANFRFALLEYHLPRALDDYIIKRENYWKSVLVTRGAFGLNRN